MQTVNIALRRRKADNVPELFFYISGPGFAELTCYSKAEQHCSASVEYLRRATKPANPSDPECAALIREWETAGPSDVQCKARIVQRLR